MKSWGRIVAVFSALAAPSAVNSAEPLPGTKPLTEPADLARVMVDGLHAYLDREYAALPARREAEWKTVLPDPATRARKVERLKQILGVVDSRLPPHLEHVGGPGRPALVGQTKSGVKAYAVRWAVLPGVDAEGLLLEPADGPKAAAVVVPDPAFTPEQTAGLVPGAPLAARHPAALAEHGFRVLVPTLIDRSDEHSANPKLNRATNQPHREFVARMAFEMGRTLTGYEVQKVLAAADWLAAGLPAKHKEFLAVVGYGGGGRIARLAGAIDPRFQLVLPVAQGGPAETMPGEPLDHNTWGFLAEFGTAELNALIRPRAMHVEPQTTEKGGKEELRPVGEWPTFAGPAAPKPGRAGAAPGAVTVPTVEAMKAEQARYQRLPWDRNETAAGHVLLMITEAVNTADVKFAAVDLKGSDPAARQKRQFDQLVGFTQKLWRDSEASRKALFAKCDTSSPAAWDKSVEPLREMFHAEAIGKLPEPTIPLNPRTRRVYDEPTWTGYEVMLDVYPDVIAAGILLLPKDLKPGERRPVVVCQHGLEGTPRHTIEIEKRPVYNHFSRRLVELGYIVYAPQNPYIFETHFRQVQRKANPLKLSLYSFIIRQHQRTIDWLETLPNVDPKRVGFYGLSYGGKTAMRVPAVEKRYAFSICSGDFNEWVGKNVSVDLDRSYMWTKEYEIYEWNLGHTFNYAEMAYLIAPRPFMVERGHDDGVGTDEMVSYEFAKVRYLYANRLKIPDRTAIEYFAGGHQVNAKETFAFIEKWIGKPRE